MFHTATVRTPMHKGCEYPKPHHSSHRR